MKGHPSPVRVVVPAWVDCGPVLYRIYNAHRTLLYVGFSTHPADRVRSHRSQPWWWQAGTAEFERCDDEAHARALELHAIRTEHPLYNRVGVDTNRSLWHQAVRPFRRVLAARRRPGIDPVSDADLRTSQYDLEAAIRLSAGAHPDSLNRNGVPIANWSKDMVAIDYPRAAS